MPCEILVCATTHTKETRGEIKAIRDTPTVWGSKEGPPNYVVVEVTDATAAQVQNYLETWKRVFDYAVVTGLDHQITITLNSKIVLTFGRGLTTVMKTYLESTWSAVFTSYAADTGEFSVPSEVVVQALRDDVLDKFEEQFGPRYLIAGTDVDTAITNGGRIAMTQAQGQSRIVDRTA